MKKPVKFSLVIPTCNEAASIELLCRKITGILDQRLLPFEIIVVDDNSVDCTWRIVEHLAKQDPRIKLLRRIGTKGLASAVASGWQVAEGEILGAMDGDLQHPPEILEAMIDKISTDSQVDIVVASRYVVNGGILKRDFRTVFRSRFAILLGRLLLPGIFKFVRDPLSGCFLMRKEVIAAQRLMPLGYKILLEVLAVGNYRNLCELPYMFAPRSEGKTKAGWQQYLDFFQQLFNLKTRVRCKLSESSSDKFVTENKAYGIF